MSEEVADDSSGTGARACCFFHLVRCSACIWCSLLYEGHRLSSCLATCYAVSQPYRHLRAMPLCHDGALSAIDTTLERCLLCERAIATRIHYSLRMEIRAAR